MTSPLLDVRGGSFENELAVSLLHRRARFETEDTDPRIGFRCFLRSVTDKRKEDHDRTNDVPSVQGLR